MEGKSVKRNSGHKGRSETILPSYKDVKMSHQHILFIKKKKEKTYNYSCMKKKHVTQM